MCYDINRQDALDHSESLDNLDLSTGCFWVKQEIREEKRSYADSRSGPERRIELNLN